MGVSMLVVEEKGEEREPREHLDSLSEFFLPFFLFGIIYR